MEKIADTLKRTTDLLTLAGRDTRLKRTGAGWWAGACPFCGGHDRFVLKQTADGWRWLCRHCTDGRYLDALDYVQRRNGVDFKEAVRELGGNLTAQHEPPQLAEPEPPQEDRTQEFNTLTTEAIKRLDDPNNRVRDYLNQRGLIEPTWRRALLGAAGVYDPKAGRKRPAVLIPYFNQALDVRAIKYRFADSVLNGLRYTSENGSRAGLYYLPDMLGYGHSLVVVEGELNLLSLAQVQPFELDLISTGSQSISEVMKQTLSRLAGRYRRVYCWFDDPQRAGEVARLTRGTPIQSPQVNGEKWDANRLLQADLLHEFISRLTGVKCYGWTLKGWVERCANTG